MSFVLIVAAITFSLLFWGLLRTAIWLVPAVLLADGFEIFSASLLSFFTVVSFLAPYEDRAFELRKVKREHWIGMFFLTGVLGGSLLYPVSAVVFGIEAVLPLILIQIFRILRTPVQEVVYFPSRIKYVLALTWTISFGLRLVEHYLD